MNIKIEENAVIRFYNEGKLFHTTDVAELKEENRSWDYKMSVGDKLKIRHEKREIVSITYGNENHVEPEYRIGVK
ncbi:hypothetical protein [Paenibacillus amylolyticus]|uniref:hypothetical protein n=1 Tax=Paenibacillus TaxID=44249 RepID=UPI000FDCBFCF|nr:hypothetical protein [Paenibacillus amylolyticus]